MPDPDAARERRTSPCPLLGDEDALYRAYAWPLRHAVRGRVRASEDQIEDACASAWLILLRAQPRRETVFAWLVIVATHEAWRLTDVDRRDAPIVHDADHAAVFDAPAAPRDPVAPLHARERLRAVAAALPERQLRMIALLALGFTYDEIAEQTGDTHRTVNRLLARAERRLDPLREPLFV